MNDDEALIRLSFFLGIFCLMALWEVIAPRRHYVSSKPSRWFNNLALVALNSVLLRLLFPAAATGMALSVDNNGWGLMNQLAIPYGVKLLVSVMVLDLAIYTQHRLFHSIPLFWRLHQVHHADQAIDVTTGLRFHPLEIVLSMLIKFAVIILLGPPVIAVIIFEVLLNATAMFNHSNIYLPPAIDRWLRLLIVTPDMHRVHHSIDRRETHRNFGFNLPWWDRLFASYCAQPRAGHKAMRIGLPEYRNPEQTERIGAMLTMPFNAPKN